MPATSLIKTLALAALASATPARQCEPPATGCQVPQLAAIDTLMSDFLCDRDIPGATIAIIHEGTLVYERGFGHADQARTVPIEPDALMRIASVSKPITAAAVRVLIDDGLLTLNTHAFKLGQPTPGILDLAPFPSLGDPRLADVTIRNLLEHEGGWNRSTAGDLTYIETTIAAAMGTASPPGRADTVRYILGQPLQHTPGTTYAYSNIGYLVLGLIVEDIAGIPLEDFIQQRVLDPLGVPDSEHQAGRTFAADQSPREPFYHSPFTATNVFDPAGPNVPRPYGSWDHEARIGQGGQITTARTLAKLLDARFISGPSIGLPLTNNLSTTWRRNHTGTLHGTESLARQRGDGIRYAVIFNARSPSSPSHASEIRTRLDQLFDSTTIDWPANGPICVYDLNSDGLLNFFDLVELINSLGPCPDCALCPPDFDQNCQTNFFDLVTLLNQLA